MSQILDSINYSDNDFETTHSDIGLVCPSSYVGFSQFPDQDVLYQSHVGFTFNVICVGETGIGKTTLINSLFNIKADTIETHPHSGMSQRSYTLSEAGTRLQLNISETVGYGKGLHQKDDWSLVCSFLDAQHSKFLEEELSRTRPSPHFADSRVHCCLYFISPNTRNGLRSFDLLAMSNISTRANLIPIIAKSDSLTRSELQNLKSSIMSSLKSAKIKIFSFSDISESSSASFNAFVPFAVMGSMHEVKIGHRVVLGRQYPWGVAQIENETHCDFIRLREAMIRTNMQELIDSTDEIYEVYRRQKLEDFGCHNECKISIDQIYTEKRAQLISDVQAKESALRNAFMNKIKDKEMELKTMEKDLYDKSKQMEIDYKTESAMLDAQFTELNEEIRCFREMKESFEIKSKKKK